jgi:hypothetical protein
METGIIMKVATIFYFFVERIDSMDDSEFKEVVYYGIFKAMKKKSESFMQHTHRRQSSSWKKLQNT